VDSPGRFHSPRTTPDARVYRVNFVLDTHRVGAIAALPAAAPSTRVTAPAVPVKYTHGFGGVDGACAAAANLFCPLRAFAAPTPRRQRAVAALAAVLPWNLSRESPDMSKPVRAVLFDLLGTLLDVHSVTGRAEDLFPGRGAALSTLWRSKQLEYTWLRTLAARYVPFTQVTEDALLAAGESLGLSVDAAARGALMHEYTQLRPFADVRPVLERLGASDVTVGILSNADPGLLEDVLSAAGLGDVFDVVLSADAARAFKTAPSVYALGTQALGHAAAEIGFVSAHAWDASGAQSFGYRAAWVNRTGVAGERLGIAPATTHRTLAEAVTALVA